MGAHGFEAERQRAMHDDSAPPRSGALCRGRVSTNTRRQVKSLGVPRRSKKSQPLGTLKDIIGGARMCMGAHGFEAESQRAMHGDSAPPRAHSNARARIQTRSRAQRARSHASNRGRVRIQTRARELEHARARIQVRIHARAHSNSCNTNPVAGM